MALPLCLAAVFVPSLVAPVAVSLAVPSVAALSGPAWHQPTFDRIHQGVCALLLSLKKRPLVRYQANSEVALRVAESVVGTMDADADLFGFRRPEVPPLLLLPCVVSLRPTLVAILQWAPLAPT